MNHQNPKTVWVICSNRWNSAITEYALSCARSLQLKGLRVVFSPLENTIAELRAKEYNLELRVFPTFGTTDIFRYRKYLRVIRPTFIIVCGGPEAALTFWGKGTAKKVCRFFGNTPAGPSQKGFLKKLGYARIDQNFYPSKFLSAHSIDPNVATVVPLGCDSSTFYRYEIMGDYVRRNRPEITLLGRFDPIKGHHNAIKLLKMTLNRWTDEVRKPCLHIIGEPANLSEIELSQMVIAEGLILGEDFKISAKRVSPISMYLSGSMLGLISSTGSEVICRVAEEFLLCGTPVYVSGVGSLEEVLFENSGASYRELDQNQIADVLIGLLQKSMSEGEAAKRRRAAWAKELFSLEAMGKALIEKVLVSAIPGGNCSS